MVSDEKTNQNRSDLAMAQYHVTIDSELLQHLFCRMPGFQRIKTAGINPESDFWRHKPRNNCELHHMKELKNAKATGMGLIRIL